MIRDKWSVKMRNTLSDLWMQCDSCAAIEGARMTSAERKELQKLLKKAIDWVDKKILPRK